LIGSGTRPSSHPGCEYREVPSATERLLAPFARDVLLATGRAVRVRPAHPDDVAALGRFYAELSKASSYFRFFGARSAVPDAELQRATVQDVDDHVTLVVDVKGELIAVGEYYAEAGHEEAEVAFAVADAHHSEGIATLLLEDLAAIAREAGFRRLVAQTLPDNTGMQRVFRDAGLVHRRWFEDGAVRVSLDLTAEDLLQDHADLRDWRAAVRSLQPLIRPRHVVVVGGAGDDAGLRSPAQRIVAGLATFDGHVSVVDGAADHRRIEGDGVTDVADLAVIAVPADEVAGAVDRCGAAGMRCAVVLTPGFAEVGADGAVLQERVLAATRRHGMRLIGPNSLGVLSTACGLDATLTGQRFHPGRIAIATQSGGVAIAIAAEAYRRRAGVASLVSMGNKADVSGNDLLRLWADDEHTNVVLLYLESFGDPVRFGRIARAASRRKPVVALKGGRSPAPADTSSLTARLLGDTGAVEALFAHTGVIRARTMEELVDVGLLLDRQPPPAGRRLALVGNAAGPLRLGADAAADAGAAVPVLVDLGASVSSHRLVEVVRSVAAGGDVDGCIVVCVELADHRVDETVRLLDGVDCDVPLAVTAIGGGDQAGGRLPTFPTSERAATAMALAAGRAAWLAGVAAESEVSDVAADQLLAARRIARERATEPGVITWLPREVAFELLAAGGVVIDDRIGAGVELLVGAARDPASGPFVVVAAGGVDAELRADRAVLVAPVGPVEARAAVERLRLAPLLHGPRGHPDSVDAVVELVTRIGSLAATVAEIAQLDLNPVIVGPGGCVARDARVAVSSPPSPIRPTRALRGP
jgi:acyl-CoA synthetase (NDP forming)/RimJ/RimL family protein N-acetyltransferase